MDQALSNALARRAEIQRELEEIDLFVKLHGKFAGTNPEQAAIPPFSPPTSPLLAHEAEAETGRVRGRPADFAEYMEGIFLDLRKPMSRAALVLELERRGIAVPSADKQRYVGTILWRHRDKFININGQGYYLKALAQEPLAGVPPNTPYSEPEEEHSPELPDLLKEPLPTITRRL